MSDDFDWMDEEKEMDDVSLKKFEDELDAIFEEKEQIALEDKALKQRKAALVSKQHRIIAHLTDLGKSKHAGRTCNVHITKQTSFKIPATPSDKAAFFDYLRSLEVFEELVSVNSRTLNSFCKQQLEIALGEGDIDFAIPGIAEPTITEKLTMKKVK